MFLDCSEETADWRQITTCLDLLVKASGSPNVPEGIPDVKVLSGSGKALGKLVQVKYLKFCVHLHHYFY